MNHRLALPELDPAIKNHVNGHGFLDREDGNHIYWMDMGKGIPTVVSHGGPAVPLGANDFLRLGLNNRRVITIHQRAAGNSVYTGEERWGHLINNTPHHTTEDHKAVLAHREIEEPVDRFGGSYGSIQSMVDAIDDPEGTGNILLWGNIDGTDKQMNRMLDGHSQLFAKDEYARLRRIVPEEHMRSYRSMCSYLLSAIKGDDLEKAKEAASAYTIYQYKLSQPVDLENSGLGGFYDFLQQPNTNDLSGSELYETLSNMMGGLDLIEIASIVLSYFENGSHLQPNYIIENLGKLAVVKRKIIVAHGANDMNTKVTNAKEMFNAMIQAGLDAKLNVAKRAGHSGSDTNTGKAISDSADELLLRAT